jgi:hypothetical protein
MSHCKINMTTGTHRYHGYELVLYQANDDRYHVTIFDPKGTSTGTHLERQVLLLRLPGTSIASSRNNGPSEALRAQLRDP